MSNGTGNHVSMKVAGKEFMEMKMVNKNLGDGEDQVPVRTEIEEMTIGFNSGYFLQGLKIMESKDVNILLKDPKSPALFTGEEDPGFIYLLMPVVLS